VKPTPEHEDTLGRLTDDDMNALKKRFLALADVLNAAGLATDPVKACEAVRAQLGDDFPVPAPEETGTKTKAPAIITSSVSAWTRP
jgi:hypothetical protein